jgi:hypothetical protein
LAAITWSPCFERCSPCFEQVMDAHNVLENGFPLPPTEPLLEVQSAVFLTFLLF